MIGQVIFDDFVRIGAYVVMDVFRVAVRCDTRITIDMMVTRWRFDESVMTDGAVGSKSPIVGKVARYTVSYGPVYGSCF